VLKVFKVLKEF